MTGTGNRFRLIPIYDNVEKMDDNVCQCLPGFHAFSRRYSNIISPPVKVIVMNNDMF